jgi:hypothetical protein
MKWPFGNDEGEQEQPWREQGRFTEEIGLENSVTGERCSVRRIHVTATDPYGGGVASHEIELPIQCSFGDVIARPEDLAFCSACGQPVCRLHSVTDPLCGHIFDTRCSVLIDLKGIPIRICRDCYAEIRTGWLRRLFQRLMGRR